MIFREKPFTIEQMIRFLVSLVYLLSAVGVMQGCAKSQPTEAQKRAERLKLQQEEFLATWKCPKGTRKAGALPPKGYEIWCERPTRVRHGPFLRWDSDGRKRVFGYYLDQKKSGRWIFWFPSGWKSAEQAFKNDQKDGIEKTWYSSGQLKSTREYKEGHAHGVTILYGENGDVQSRVIYEKGTIVETP